MVDGVRMKSKIILSYRRSDSEVITGRIRDKLANHYGEDGVFMDTESIPLGFDYRKQIKDALLKNKVFIAVIGPKWLGGSGREARINEENDPVRIEVETALQQGLPIIPVLVSGATIPKATELPQSLHALCYLNGTEVDGGGDFHLHMGRVIQAIDQIVKASEAAPSRPSRKWPLLALGAIGCLILAAIGIWAYTSISDYVKSAVTRVAPYIDQAFYYKLSTEFRGSNMKLDVINGGPNENLTQLEPDQNVSGQYWRFLANADGTFRLTTLFRGPNMCLDIFNGGPNNNQPHLAECANVSGQLWNIREEGNSVRLTTLFRGPNMCLDIFNGGPNNNQPHLAECASVSGQLWTLTKTNESVENAAKHD
jgi:hypothetical protein